MLFSKGREVSSSRMLFRGMPVSCALSTGNERTTPIIAIKKPLFIS
jgi:hypothetical protein